MKGRVLLKELRDRSRLQGVDDLDIRQRYGQLLSTLEEQQDEVALYVLGRRGQSATHRAETWVGMSRLSAAS